MKRNMCFLGVCLLLVALAWGLGMQSARAAEAAKDIGRFEFRWVVQDGEKDAFDEVVWNSVNGGSDKAYKVAKEAVVTDEDISKAVARPDQSHPGKSMVLVELWPEASERLKNSTREKVGHECALIIDGAILNVATVRDAISHRMAVFGMNPDAAGGLARLLSMRAKAPVSQWLSPPEGIVLDPSGQPVAGADVVVLPSGAAVKGRTAKLSEQPFPPGVVVTKTAGDGKFKCDDIKKPYLILAESAAGYAEITGEQLLAAKEIRLTPFARVGGRVYCGRDPYKNGPVALVMAEPKRRVGGTPGEEVQIFAHVFTNTDEEGKYVFDRVRQGRYSVCYANGEGTVPIYATGTAVEAKSGEAAECVIGDPVGGSVKGKLHLDRWNLPPVALDKVRIHLMGTVSGVLTEAMDKSAQEAWQEFSNSECGRQRDRVIKAEPDGSFHAEGLSAGEYGLDCSVFGEDIGVAGDSGRAGGNNLGFTLKPEKKDIDLGEVGIGQNPRWKMPLTSRLWNWVSGTK